jgi:hypothetical protein
MSIDLDITNYDLKDILNLFKIPENFDERDLKRAKQIVLKTHPDKSKLPSEYFRFYSKAYKMLYQIWEFRKKGNTNTNTDYSVENEDHESKARLLDDFFDSNKKFKNTKDFNRWFNEQFERNKVSSEQEEKGYGEWFKSGEDMEDTTCSNMSMMKQEFDKKKEKARSLVVRQDIQEISLFSSSKGSDLSLSAPSHYNSDLFSSLAYQDLHQAHTETVIPITEADYHNIQKFGSVDEYMRHRDTQKLTMKPLTERESEKFLMKKSIQEEEQSTRRAFELAKQAEIAKQKNKEFWSGIQMLKNK